MSLAEKAAWFLDDVTHRVGGAFKQTVDSYCDLDTREVESEHALVDYRGGLHSVIHVTGTHDLAGKDETIAMIESLASSIGPMMNNPAYSIQIIFEYDPAPDTGNAELQQQIVRLKRGAKRSGLVGVDDVIDDMYRALSGEVAYEQCTLVVSTSPQLLRKKQMKDETKQAVPYRMENLPAGQGTQNTRRTLTPVVDAHEAFVDAVEGALANAGSGGNVLTAHEACFLIRMQLDPEFTAPDWQASLAGDPIPMADTGRPKPDSTDMLWAPLAGQLIPRDPITHNLRTVEIGDRVYSPIQIACAPREPKPFAALFASLRKNKTPARISFRLMGDGIARMGMRAQVANILAFSSAQNRRINTAFQHLQEFVKTDGGVAVGLTVDAVTWAPRDKLAKLRRNANRLSTTLQSWGGTQVEEIVSKPVDAVTASCSGLRVGSPSNVVCIPLEDALVMAPLMRPSTPWESGNMLFRAGTKLWPYGAYSSLQDAWISLIFAPMGRGKSVLLNALNFGLCMDETNKALPIIRVMDIGFSSSGLVSLLRDALPEGRKHEALYKKLTMSSDSAINILDTPLGCRHPLPGHLDFLTDYLALLATPTDASEPPDGMAGIAKMVVKMAYGMYADDNRPKPYNAGTAPDVDKALAARGIGTDEDTTWWEVTDALAAEDDYVNAYIAQSYAMPVLSDCAALAKTDAVRGVYKGKSVSGTELGDYFWRLITEAVADYPILNAPTRFNFGSARVISLDLQDVAPKGGGKAARQTALMYSMAMWIMSSDFFIGEESMMHVPDEVFFTEKELLNDRIPNYKRYHRSRIDDLRNVKKRLAADEFHRTAGQTQVQAMFETIIREGRKWKVEVVLASQRYTDFNDTMIGLSSSRFILGSGVGEAEATAKKLSLGASAQFLIEHSLTGPGKGGSPLLAAFDVKGKPGHHTQLLHNVQGARALWAFSSSSDDVLLRNKLYARLGSNLARKVLAASYPGGSVDKEVHRRNTAFNENNEFGDEFSGQHDPLKDIERELLEDAHRLRAEEKKDEVLA